MNRRVEVGGGGDQPGEQRRVLQREVLGLLGEEGLRRGLDPVRALPEVHRVQVLREDLVLRVALLELERELRFVDLAPEGLLVAYDRVLDVLLGDGGAALDDAAGRDVREGRSDHGLHVDAAVLVEALVLHGDDRVADVLRDLRERNDHTVLPSVERGDQRAVVGVEERRLRERLLLVLGHREVRKVAGRREQREDRDRRRGPHAGELHRRTMIVTRSGSGAIWR